MSNFLRLDYLILLDLEREQEGRKSDKREVYNFPVLHKNLIILQIF